jgi:multidrug resistance efflux pump
VTDITVGLHEEVEPGRLLVQIDTQAYQIGVRSARAQLDNVLQQIGGQSAGVEAAAAKVAALRAQEDISLREFERIESIRERNASAISQSDRDRAEAAWLGSVAQVQAAEADVRRIEATLGSTGLDNPSVRAAMAGLEQAELNLARTSIRAPSRGAIESLELDVGHFAGAGQALMTFVSTGDVWLQADFRENSLANLAPGVPVEILLDAVPGEVLTGTVRSVGLGVGDATPASRGSLPSVSQQRGWLRQPQQFPVIVDFGDDVPREALRHGAQASVRAFTGRAPLLNPLGRLLMRVYALMSYVR